MRIIMNFIFFGCIAIALLSIFCVDDLNQPEQITADKVSITILEPDAKLNGMPYKIGEQVARKIIIKNPYTVDTMIVDYGEPKNPNNIDRLPNPSSSTKEYTCIAKVTYLEVGKKTITVTLIFNKKYGFPPKTNTGLMDVGVEPKIREKQIICSTDQLFIGAACTLSVEVAEFGNTEYRWEKNNGILSGEIRKKLILPSISNNNAGTYKCFAKNEYGADTSKEFVLSITANPKPKITLQPQSQQVTIGTKVTFKCTAIPENVKYQWFRNGAEIPNETNSHYTLNSVAQEDDNAKFKCKVSNDNGVVVSTEALLKVFGTEQKPEITKHPSNLTVAKGERALFSIDANGTNLVFQWQKNGSDIPNATLKIFQTEPVTEADNGAKFKCKVTNSAGSETSSEALLTVQGSDDNIKPQIIQEPSDVEVTEGGEATFQVIANGKNLRFQWKCNGNDISGETNEKCKITGIKKSDNGSRYKCVVTNTIGSVTSKEATLKVVDKIEKVVITKQPENQTVKKGESAKFSVTVTGTNPTYQWHKNGTPISSDATSATYTTPATEKTDNETKYCCVIKNSAGEVKSEEVKLTVQWAPKIIRQPENKEVKFGESVTFSVEIEDGNPNNTKVEWKDNTGNLVGSEKQCTIQPKKEDNAKYYKCTASNEIGKDESIGATLNVFYIEINTHPVAQEVTFGKDISFSVDAIGNPTPQYQWLKNGLSISGTSKNFSKSSATFDDGGDYSCKVFNDKGCSETSRTARLKVNDVPPRITSDPTSAEKLENESVTFAVEAEGTNLRFQWYKNGQMVSGGSNKSLTYSQISARDDQARFNCSVSNSAAPNGVKSNNATLTVYWISKNVTISPSTASINAGQSQTFRANNATGNPQITYNWKLDGNNLNNNSDVYNHTTDNNVSGNYRISCVITNSKGLTSNQATATLEVKKLNSDPDLPLLIRPSASGSNSIKIGDPNEVEVRVSDPDGINDIKNVTLVLTHNGFSRTPIDKKPSSSNVTGSFIIPQGESAPDYEGIWEAVITVTDNAGKTKTLKENVQYDFGHR